MQGEILPWRDVLHEGPIDSRLAPEDLSRKRAEFIAAAGWAPRDEVLHQFAERDTALRRAGEHDEVVLWFEHDLYDQLQLIQLLAWFAVRPHARLTLVCEAEYLGNMAPARAAALFTTRARITGQDLQAGLAAWAVLGSPDFPDIELRITPTQNLRFLRAALRRMLQEFPWTTDGLSRLEREALAALRPAPLRFAELFGKVQVQEEARFLGDAVLQWHLERMAREDLVERRGEQWAASGKTRAHREPRWLGGVHLDGKSPLRWDPASGRVIALG
jgi:hypothetical protein